MLEKLREWWFAEQCPACRKRGFLYSWSGKSSLEQIMLTEIGYVPKDAHCVKCGQTFEPVLADMGSLALVPGQKGWVMNWFTWK